MFNNNYCGANTELSGKLLKEVRRAVCSDSPLSSEQERALCKVRDEIDSLHESFQEQCVYDAIYRVADGVGGRKRTRLEKSVFALAALNR